MRRDPAADRSRRPALDATEWRSWEGVLTQYSNATQLVVGVFSPDGRRELGPTLPSAMTRFLARSSLWADDGPGTVFERNLASRCIEQTGRVSDRFLDVLQVDAIPMLVDNEPVGAATFGWVYPEYATGLGAERLARNLGLDGRALWSHARMQTPVPEAKMNVYAGLLTTIVDSGTELRRAIGELQRVQNIREVFLAHVSHELRTPLAAISMRLELLKAGGGRFDQNELIDAIARNVMDESRLIEDLIDVARTTTGQLTISPRRTMLNGIIDRAIDSVRPAAEKKPIALHVSVPSRALPIDADEDRLQQVFWNVMTNAIKFTSANGHVGIDVEELADEYLISIRDNGIGIGAEELPTLFDSFSRRRSRQNEKGLGVGLAIAAHIVAMHNGRIEASSDGPGHGASFAIALPIPR